MVGDKERQCKGVNNITAADDIMDGRWPQAYEEREQHGAEPEASGPTVSAVAVVSAAITLAAAVALREGILGIMNMWRNTQRRIYEKDLRSNQEIDCLMRR